MSDVQQRIEAMAGIGVAAGRAFRTELAAGLRAAAAQGPIAQPIGIRALLEWAFRAEKVRLEFADRIRAGGRSFTGVGIEYLMMTRGATGCRIDGGGVSYPHDDAEIVADAVIGLRRRDLALWVAELARVGCAPDPMIGVRTRCVPVGWQRNQHRATAQTVDAREIDPVGGQPAPRRNRKGVVVCDVRRCCPIRYEPGAGRIAQARRAYLDWHGALHDLRDVLQGCGLLSMWRVTDELPPRTPWRKNV